MRGPIVENLRGRKPLVLVGLLIIVQIICILIGILIIPMPVSSQSTLAFMCKDDRESGNASDTAKLFYPKSSNESRGNCDSVDTSALQSENQHQSYQPVYIFQTPTPKNNVQIGYSRWHQTLIGAVQVDITRNDRTHIPKTSITLDVQLAYRNKNDKADAWKLYASSKVERTLECVISNETKTNTYECDTIPLFKLGSLYHDSYLLNVRLLIDNKNETNHELRNVTNMWLITVFQNKIFSKIWISLRTVFFPIVLYSLVWYWRRIHFLMRSPSLLEHTLFALGISLLFLNTPLEYLTLIFDMPIIMLLNDIRQNIFYIALLSFWLVLASEYLIIQEGEQQNSLTYYWRHFIAVFIGCSLLFAFDMYEHVVQLKNPFFSLWVTDAETKFIIFFIIYATILAGFYLICLAYMVWRVFNNISINKASSPSTSSARQLHYEGVVYRFKLLMIVSLWCALLTAVGYILGQMSDGEWKWNEYQEHHVDITSAFFIGVYGMWNIYTMALLYLHAPSYKK